MNQNLSESDSYNNYKPISDIETFNSIFDDINQKPLLKSVNQSIEKQIIPLQIDSINDINDIKQNKKNYCTCNSKTSLYKLYDSIMFAFMFLTTFYDLISAIIRIFELAISLYSVIIMNYVFFISSIISYTMAPIYKILSSDVLNFLISYAQVILASPLIAFYIYFILKSVIALGENISDFFNVIKKIFSIIKGTYKNCLVKFISMAFKSDYQLIFDWDLSFDVIKGFLQVSFLLSSYLAFGYAMFFIDKCIIILGGFDYLFNIISIAILLFPSYIYFIQTIFNKKCKRINFVEKMIRIVKEKILKKDKDKSSDPSNSTDLVFKKLDQRDAQTDKESSNESESDNLESIQLNLNKDNLYLNLSIQNSKKFSNLFRSLNGLIYAENFFPLYYYSTSIALDRYKQNRKRITMIVFFLLNLIVIAYDIYQLIKDYSDYLLASIIVRFILIPLFSYYNIVIVLCHKAKDNTLRIVNYISIVFTLIIFVAILVGLRIVNIYNSKFRLNDLDYIPAFNNITIVNEKLLKNPICSYQIYNVSAFDAFGYSLGGYDIKRNKTIFENQMKIFFGENYSNRISYSIYELDKNFLFLKFYDSSINTHIFAFRGYNSGPEIAFQFELFVSHYIIPFFEDNVPFLETINENWLGFYTDFLNSFGLRFFENRNLIVNYVKSIMEIYESLDFDENDNVFFTGLNCGGVIAKVVGTLLYRRSISFISFPMEMDFLQNWFHFSSSYTSYVTNVFNVDGFFSRPDSEYAINIGIETPTFYKSKRCSSDFCDVFSRTDNIYRTFCTMSEICGKGNQFTYYCKKSIGGKDLRLIRESLEDSD